MHRRISAGWDAPGYNSRFIAGKCQQKRGGEEVCPPRADRLPLQRDSPTEARPEGQEQVVQGGRIAIPTSGIVLWTGPAEGNITRARSVCEQT